MKILIADDENYMREDLRDILERVTGGGNEYSFADSYDSAMSIAGSRQLDIAFLDIQMPGKNGLALAESIKRRAPKVNIVIVTAYERYALDALKLFVSGYLLKPVMDDDLRQVLNNLRNPVESGGKKLDVICFGNFDVFVGSRPLAFKRKKEKEILAYLICLKGASATRGEICAAVFEEDSEKTVSYFKTIIAALRSDLRLYGYEDILIHGSNSYSVDVNLIRCDYYDYLRGKADGSRSYRGEFLSQYSWAERFIYSLENY